MKQYALHCGTGSLLHNERGMALIFALLIMVVLAIIGAAATMTSQVDVRISGNTRVLREAFYLADGGIETSPKVVSQMITNRALPGFAETPSLLFDGVIYDDPSSPSAYIKDTSQTVTLVDKIMGYESNDDASDDSEDIVLNLAGYEALAVNVTRGATAYLSGGGVEFAAGTEGVGVAGAASTAVFYTFESSGTSGRAPNSTVSRIAARYRKVAGVAGGR